MGNMTGLNPVWIIVSLFVGGKLGGVLGLLLAVPLASVIKSTVNSLRDRPTEPSEPLLIEEVSSETENSLVNQD
jgi:predicted PurR-regulated permease PerM